MEGISLSQRQFQRQADVFVYWSAHQSVHNVLAELLAVVAVDGVCQTDNHFKVIHVYVPVRTVGEQPERAVSIFLTRDTILIYRAYRAEYNG